MTYSSVVIAQTPISYWRLGDASSPLVDQMGVHNGTAGAGTAFGATGAISGDDACTFGGSTAVIATSGFSIASTNWSVSGYAKNISPAPTTFHTSFMGLTPGTGAQTQRALCCTRRNATNNRLCYWDNTNSWQESSVTLTLDAWAHVAWTKSGTTLKIYHEGIEVGSFTLTEPSDTYTDLFIGGSQSTGSDAMKGDLDEAAVWSRALTAAEVLTQYNAGRAFDRQPNRRRGRPTRGLTMRGLR